MKKSTATALLGDVLGLPLIGTGRVFKATGTGLMIAGKATHTAGTTVEITGEAVREGYREEAGVAKALEAETEAKTEGERHTAAVARLAKGMEEEDRRHFERLASLSETPAAEEAPIALSDTEAATA